MILVNFYSVQNKGKMDSESEIFFTVKSIRQVLTPLRDRAGCTGRAVLGGLGWLWGALAGWHRRQVEHNAPRTRLRRPQLLCAGTVQELVPGRALGCAGLSRARLQEHMAQCLARGQVQGPLGGG